MIPKRWQSLEEDRKELKLTVSTYHLQILKCFSIHSVICIKYESQLNTLVS